MDDRYVDSSSLVGGIIGKEGVVYVGSTNIKLDGEKIQITMNEGGSDILLIGKES